MIGRVKWFNNTKGYGFAEYNEDEDILVHYSTVEIDGYKTLTEGDLISCNLFKTVKGFQSQRILNLNNEEEILN